MREYSSNHKRTHTHTHTHTYQFSKMQPYGIIGIIIDGDVVLIGLYIISGIVKALGTIQSIGGTRIGERRDIDGTTGIPTRSFATEIVR